ncbi:MAG: zinc ribbon domain-containing protein [Anaerolineae bacterium]|jgi:putative FmdB family regulatory protein|nr:zinc ribbon domain-containing protein [Anaerolineae bacterium]
MAIYEYQCAECGAAFQARRAMKDADAPITCPDCGSFQAKRGLSRFFSATSGGGNSGVSTSGGGGCASCSGHSCASCGGH